MAGFRNICLVTATSFLSLSGLSSAHAQTTSTEEPTERRLDPITVTAQKQSELLSDVPISIQAFDTESLETLRIDGFEDLANFSPSLVASPNPGETSGLRLSIRGIGLNDPQIGLDTTVGLYVDEVYIGKSSGLVFDTPDLERIEVLKGPQGTLYGRNAVAGAINIVTKGAEVGEFQGSVTGEYGNFNEHKVEGVLNVPLGEKAAIKIAALNSSRDGFVENDGPGSDFGGSERTGLTLAAKWLPTDNLQLSYGFDYSENEQQPFFNQPRTDRDGNIGLLLEPNFGSPEQLVDIVDGRQETITSTVEIGTGISEVLGHNAKAKWDWHEDHSARIIFGYREADSRSFASFFPAVNVETLNAELNRVSPQGGSLITGLTILPAIVGLGGGTTRPDFNDPLQQEFLTLATGADEVPTLDDHKQYSVEGVLQGTLSDRIEYTIGTLYFDEDTAGGPFPDRPRDALGAFQLLPAAFALEPFFGNTFQLAGLNANLNAALADPTSTDEQISALQDEINALEQAQTALTSDITDVLDAARSNVARIDLQTQSIALFGQVSYQIIDPLSFTLGLRWSRDKKSAQQQGFSPFFNDTTSLLNTPIEPLDGSETFISFDPTFILEYEPNDDILIYGSFAEGFRSGGFNQAARSFDDFVFDEEKVQNFEAGIKSEWLENKLRLNANYFRTRIKDQQFTLVDPLRPISRLIGNNDARFSGVEIEGQYLLTDHLTTSFAYTYLETGSDEIENPFTGEILTDTADNSPRNSFSLNLDYRNEIGPGDLILHLGYNHQDATTITSVPRTESDLVDARATYAFGLPNGHQASAYVYGQNLTDDEFTIDALDAFGPLVSGTEVFGLPRTFGVGLKYEF